MSTWREDVDYEVTERNDDGSPRFVKPLHDPDFRRRYTLALCTGDVRHLDRERWPGELASRTTQVASSQRLAD